MEDVPAQPNQHALRHQIVIGVLQVIIVIISRLRRIQLLTRHIQLPPIHHLLHALQASGGTL